jgi:hypothetical protein
MAEGLETFSFDNEEIRSGIYEKYKGKKGQIDRCAIIYTDPKAMFAGTKVHFKERFFLCKKGKCCEICGPAKWRVGSVIIKYGTDKQGNPKKPFSYELFPWIFSEQTYIKLKGVNSEFPLATHDVKISCTNEEYQHLDIVPCSESIWTHDENLKNQVIVAAKPIWEYIKRGLASDLSIEEINDLLGVSQQAASDPSTSLDLDSVMDKAI